MSNSYSELLRDPRWQKKRLKVLERADWKCENCGDSKSELQVHHTFYDGRKPWKYPKSSLKCLCKSCHENEHTDENHNINALDSNTFQKRNLNEVSYKDLFGHERNWPNSQKGKRNDFILGLINFTLSSITSHKLKKQNNSHPLQIIFSPEKWTGKGKTTLSISPVDFKNCKFQDKFVFFSRRMSKIVGVNLCTTDFFNLLKAYSCKLTQESLSNCRFTCPIAGKQYYDSLFSLWNFEGFDYSNYAALEEISYSPPKDLGLNCINFSGDILKDNFYYNLENIFPSLIDVILSKWDEKSKEDFIEDFHGDYYDRLEMDFESYTC